MQVYYSAPLNDDWRLTRHRYVRGGSNLKLIMLIQVIRVPVFLK